MNTRRWKLAGFLLSAAMLLGGCQAQEKQEWIPKKEDAVSISENGRITEYLTTTLDQSYYSFDELCDMTRKEIAEYASAYGADAVTLLSAERQDQTVKLVLEYAGAEEYARFNHVKMYYGSIIGAQMEGYLFEEEFKQVEDGVVKKSGLSAGEIMKHLTDEVLVVQTPLEVHVPGSITFLGADSEALAADTAYAAGKQDDEEKSSPISGEISYIIFEKE